MEFNRYLVEEKAYSLQVAQQKAGHYKGELPLINLTIGDPKGSPYEPVKDALSHDVSTMTCSQYPVAAGNVRYLRSVATWATSYYGVTMDPSSEIVSCNGTKEAIFSIPLLFDWTSGKRLFIPSLSYPVYKSSAGIFNIPVKELPLSETTGFLPDLDSITDEEWKSCGLFWINSPHNPTTAIASKAYLKELLNKAEQYDFLICSDECYNELYYAEKPASFLEFQDSKHWLVFSSLSKRSHMTGFRMGAILSKHKDLIGYLKKMRSPMGVGTPTFIQNASALAWEDNEHARHNALYYGAIRDRLKPILEQKGFSIFGADAGFYLWMKHRTITSSDALVDLFLSVGILVTSGTAFGRDGEGYIRMVYCDTDIVMKDVERRLHMLEVAL